MSAPVPLRYLTSLLNPYGIRLSLIAANRSVAYSPPQPLPVIVPHVTMLTRAMLEIGANRGIDLSIREMALTVVQWIAA